MKMQPNEVRFVLTDGQPESVMWGTDVPRSMKITIEWDNEIEVVHEPPHKDAVYTHYVDQGYEDSAGGNV